MEGHVDPVAVDPVAVDLVDTANPLDSSMLQKETGSRSESAGLRGVEKPGL